MNIEGKKLVVIGGAGLIGSHTVDLLTREDVGEVLIYDNFVRGSAGNIDQALKDPRVRIYDVGGDICQTDILDAALKCAHGVFHFAALWLLQCHEFPRAAFDVNIRGAFNVLEACVANGVERLVYSSSASVYGDAVEEPMTEDHPFNNKNFYGATKICGEAMARAYHHRYGLNYVGLRYMNVYGPRQDYHGAYIAVIMKMLDAIDRGDVLVRIPTTVHASLNVAQAVLVAAYELHVAAGDATRDVARHKHHAALPKRDEWERALGDIDRALAAIAFYRTRNPEHIMRSVRSLLNRAGPDSRELTLVRAMGIEVLRTLDRVRRGLEPE
jgi:nucleoside-diphosphate-sugar epimerase